MAKEKKIKKEKSKVRKILEWVGTGIFVALITFSAVVLLTTKIQRKNSPNPNAPAKIGHTYFPVVVLTSSMEPLYMTGDAIFIKEISCETIRTYYKDEETYSEKAKINLTFFDNYMDLISSEETAHVAAAYGKTYRTSNIKRTMTHQLFYMTVDESIEYGKGRYHFFVNGINPNSGSASAPYEYQVFTESELYGQATGSSAFIGWVFRAAESPWGLVVLLIIPSLYMVLSSVIDVVKAYKEEGADGQEPPQENALDSLSKKDRERLKQELLEQMIEDKKKKKEDEQQ